MLAALLAKRQFGFPVERAIFAEVLHRLLAPGLRSGRRAQFERRSVRGSPPASPAWVSRKTFPSCVDNRPARSISNVILLETNVLSALMQDDPDPLVPTWLDSLPGESVWTTSITVFEIRLGLELLAGGRRRRKLEEAFLQALAEDFEGRVVPFDEAAAEAAGRIAAERRRAGRTVEIRDVQIAGIAAARKATFATRNLRHFEGLGLALVNPWSE